MCAGDDIIDKQKEIIKKLVTKEFSSRVLWEGFLSLRPFFPFSRP
jgi:hypothetical protein